MGGGCETRKVSRAWCPSPPKDLRQMKEVRQASWSPGTHADATGRLRWSSWEGKAVPVGRGDA